MGIVNRSHQALASAVRKNVVHPTMKHEARLSRPVTPMPKSDSLCAILENETIDFHFQPVVSLKNTGILGHEALARPADAASGASISPIDLFGQAFREGRSVELDRLCRRKALRAFRTLSAPSLKQRSCPLLFLNFESSVLDMGVLGSGMLARAVDEAGLRPQEVVIEINESRVSNLEALKSFVDTHRTRGFLIALDDLGTGFSNLSRISLLRPDILKLDRLLVMQIEDDFHKQEVFRSVVNLGRRVGALILAEGVE